MLFFSEYSHGHSGSGVHTAFSVLPAERNCRRVEEARRVSFHIDGDADFSAFRAAAIRAQQSLMILGWGFDSRTRRVIDQKPE